MVRITRAIVLTSLTAALLAGCGQAAHTLAPAGMGASSLNAQGALPPAPKNKEEFLAAVKKAGIKLSEKDIEMLTAERHVVPTGEFAARPAANLTAEQNLEVHFNKHGHEFKPAIESPAAYIAQGIAAGTGKRGEVHFFFDTTSFEKGYQTHIVRWVPKTKDFCAFRTDGAMTTYYQNFSVSPKRFIEVPALK